MEEETAVCFVDTYRSPEYAPGSTENSPEFTSKYLSQLKEMVENHRNHPSVIIWSIGNENKFGVNFQKSFDWVKKMDPTRPVIFSFPGTVKDPQKPYDILSMHYPNIDGTLEQYGINIKGFTYDNIPVLFDEWAHVPCYNGSTIKEDPNVRDFWGRSLDSMWIKTYDAEGALGGAIWGMIDETFMLPDTVVGYGEWGIVDTWRRKKPEFWNVKKAYSPVRLLQTEFADFKPNSELKIPVYNRYNSTNLDELKIRYSYDGVKNEITAPDIPAHSKGYIQLPLKEWKSDKPVFIEFLDSEKKIIDSYYIKQINKITANLPILKGSISLTVDDSKYIISFENHLKLFVDKNTGLFESYEINGTRTPFTGPWLNCRTKEKGNQTSTTRFNDYGTNWKMDKLSVIKGENSVEVSVEGSYTNALNIAFQSEIFPDASITVNYKVSNLPKEYVRELGLKFILDDSFQYLAWERDGFWSFYPENDLSALKGQVQLYSNKQNIYRQTPVKDWQYDSKSFYYDEKSNESGSQFSYIAKATKENILKYKLSRQKAGSLEVEGTGQEGCRINKEGNRITLFIDNILDYPDLSWGNYQKNILLQKEFSGQLKLTLHQQ